MKFVGSGEGSQAFGYGIYLEQSPEVAEIYRRYGNNFHVITADGRDFNITQKGSWNDIDDSFTRTILDDAADLLQQHRFTGYSIGASAIKNRLLEEYISQLEQNRDILKKRKISAQQKSISQKYVQSFQRKIDILHSMKFTGIENGNVYDVDIPEDYDLLDWNETAEKQSEQVKTIFENIVEDISSNREKFTFSGKKLAEEFTEYAGKKKITARRIEKIINLIVKNNYEPFRDIYSFRKLPEYERLARILKNDDLINSLMIVLILF